MLLPGMITALTLANVSVLVIPLVILFLIAYDNGRTVESLIVMVLLFFVHSASVVFFISVFIYSILKKEKIYAFVSAVAIAISVITLRVVQIGGKPTGHFMDLIALYAALFSPLLFIYFFYTMYRIFLREEKNILWFISFTALLLSLLLSIRQRVIMTDFAPYVVISVVLMLDTYYKSYRIRLPQYRKWYKRGFILVMTLLVFSSLTIIFHKALFYVIKDPKKHFASKLYEPYRLAERLKLEGKSCYDTEDGRVATQLRFYGIGECRN
jgi:hypothetical protein